MVDSRSTRRAAREARARQEFGPTAGAALDLLELVDLAWHDCFGASSPDERVIDDIFVVAAGRWPDLVHAARLAVEDFRDLRMNADSLRA